MPSALGLIAISRRKSEVENTWRERPRLANVKSYGEGPVMIWFLEDYRDDVVLVVRVRHFGSPDQAG
jgi:hypothetical protein